MTRESQRSGLSATAVDRARPREKPYKLSDRDGLYLLVKPSGARYWRMNFKLHQLQRTASFGRYPEVSLAEARQRLLEARRQLKQGIDPVYQAKLNKMAASIAAGHTFRSVAEEWLEKMRLEEKSAKSIRKCEWQLSIVTPDIGNRPILQDSSIGNYLGGLVVLLRKAVGERAQITLDAGLQIFGHHRRVPCRWSDENYAGVPSGIIFLNWNGARWRRCTEGVRVAQDIV